MGRPITSKNKEQAIHHQQIRVGGIYKVKNNRDGGTATIQVDRITPNDTHPVYFSNRGSLIGKGFLAEDFIREIEPCPEGA